MNPSRRRRAALGAVYILVSAALIATSVGTYRKDMPWQRSAEVSLVTPNAGLELNPQSDVKFQSVLVGSVRQIRSNGTNATIILSLDKRQLHHIPADVDAAIVPKTLFGEKYVDLRVRTTSGGERLADGATIRQSTTSVEISTLFNRLVPMLRAFRPEELSTVLSTAAEALDGRGSSLARVLNQLRTTAGGLDPHLETLINDLDDLDVTADVYAKAAPDLGRLLDAGAELSDDLLVPKQKLLREFLADVIDASAVSQAVLRENSNGIISITGNARPLLRLLDEYATSLPCTVSGLRTFENLVNHAIGAGGPVLNLSVDTVTQRSPYRYPDDLPSNPTADANNKNLPDIIPNWKPHCPNFSAEVLALNSPAPYSQPLPQLVFDRPLGATRPSSASTDLSDNGSVDAALADTREALSRATAAGLMDIQQDDVPPYAGILLEPMLSDGEMELP